METKTMEQLIQEFVNYRVWALVGYSDNPAKYGHRIFHDLKSAGYKIYAVNPKGGQVNGQPVYPSLRDLPEKPAVVDIVVPPAVTEQVVKECKELGLTRIWMQPGAESMEAVRFCRENGLEVIFGGPCAMVHKRYWN